MSNAKKNKLVKVKMEVMLTKEEFEKLERMSYACKMSGAFPNSTPEIMMSALIGAAITMKYKLFLKYCLIKMIRNGE